MKAFATISDLKKTACWHLNTHLETHPPVKKARQLGRPAKHVDWLHWNISLWCKEKGLYFHKELQFHAARKYRLDFAVTDLELPEKDYFQTLSKCKIKLAIEYQGGIFMEKSGHTNVAGATLDADKSALAHREGWKYLTFLANNYKTVLQELASQLKI